ncbi:MAG TPA: polysaccharide biosynthesis tyrosine autokinase [Anaerolineales bacterium]|nr:polysaccharide biosynthesis tyrosine autokinase [Anaerolineales bacterium]
MNDFMELRRVITIALRRWWLLVALTVLGAVAGYVISRAQTPVYQATTTVLVGESIRSSSVDRVDIQISEALMQTYVEIARRQPVLQAVVTALNLEESWQQLASRVTVGLIDSTQLIEITVEARSPELAETIADELVHQLILLSPSGTESGENQLTGSFNREQIARLQERIVNGQQRLVEIDTALNNSISETELTALQQEKTTLEGLLIEWERNYTQLLTLTESKGDPTQLTIVEPAHSNNRMIRPRIQLNTLLGAGVGMILALGLVFLLELLDDTFRSLKDFSQSEEVNVLGSIRRIRGKKLSDKLIAHLQPHSPITESYRIVRSRIRFKRGEGTARSIMVTSSMPDEGKSLTAANLAVVFAQANFKTIVVDANLRHPILHEVFAVRNDSGLGDALSSSEIHVKEYLQDTSVNNLQILSGGTPLADPSGQLGSERMEEIIRDLKKSADIVIFDSPPALVFADAIVLSRRVDGVIMVIQAGKSKRSAINQTLLDLQNANADLLGSVFNLSPKSDTFSVNKAYMQERPKVSFAQGLAKKDTQLNNLGDFVPPVSANVEVAEPRSETADTDVEKQLELGDLATPTQETAEASVSTNGFKPTQIDPSRVTESATDTNRNEPVQLQDLDYSASDVEEQIEELSLESEKATIDEAQSSDLDVSPMPAGENEEATLAVDQSEFDELEDMAQPADNDLESYPQNGEAYTKGDENNNRAKRKRHRMSRRNKEFTNEEIPVASSDVPGEQTNE